MANLALAIMSGSYIQMTFESYRGGGEGELLLLYDMRRLWIQYTGIAFIEVGGFDVFFRLGSLWSQCIENGPCM